MDTGDWVVFGLFASAVIILLPIWVFAAKVWWKWLVYECRQ